MLSEWKNQGLSNIECAKRLGRDKSTIGRELERNKVKVKVGKYDEYIYEPNHAQFVSDERKQRAWLSKQPLKNKDIYKFVLEHLREGWSPEVIAGRLKFVEHPYDLHWWICHETIYQFIYKRKTDLSKQALVQKSILDHRFSVKPGEFVTVTNFDKPLWEYLRRKQKRRRKRGGRKAHRVRIPDRVSIHQRLEIVLDRIQPGHWEGDTLVGLGRKSGLHTAYERFSSLIRFERMRSLSADESVNAQYRIYAPLPDDLRISTTLDNGSEHVEHKRLESMLGIKSYFADPYSAYQRGGNENANLWIRYYFPKRTDFSKVSDEDLADVEWELNQRPRKRLQYRKPQEVFDELLKLP